MLSDQVCTVESCANKVSAKGLCHKHYMRKRRTGSHNTVRTVSGTGKGFRWLSKAIKKETDDCIIWPFSTLWTGYGQLSYEGKNGRLTGLQCF